MAPALNEGFLKVEGQAAQSFDLPTIEAELRAMWKSSSGPAHHQGAPVRAAMANLVVPCDFECLPRILPVLIEVTRRHPSRLILVQIAPGGSSPELRAEVAALCHLRTEGGYVCSEQILLSGDAPAGAFVPSAVRALLVGDLPAVLLDIHGGAPVAWIDEIADRADLVVADSALADRVDTQRALWKRIVGDDRLRDLAWARVTPWREVLAEAFDATRLTGMLGQVTEVVIEFGEARPAPPAVPLLAGWLGSRLGWKPRRREDGGWWLDGPAGGVRLEMIANREGAGQGLRRVSLCSPGKALDLEVWHHGREAVACVRARAPVAQVRDVPYSYRDFASCLVGEIHRHEANPLLQEAAALALALTEPERRAA